MRVACVATSAQPPGQSAAGSDGIAEGGGGGGGWRVRSSGAAGQLTGLVGTSETRSHSSSASRRNRYACSTPCAFAGAGRKVSQQHRQSCDGGLGGVDVARCGALRRGAAWCGMVRGGAGWCGMVRDGAGWCEGAQTAGGPAHGSAAIRGGAAATKEGSLKYAAAARPAPRGCSHKTKKLSSVLRGRK